MATTTTTRIAPHDIEGNGTTARPLNPERAIESLNVDLRDARDWHELAVEGVDEALSRVERIESELARRRELKRARDRRYRARRRQARAHLAQLLAQVREGHFELVELTDGGGWWFQRNGKASA